MICSAVALLSSRTQNDFYKGIDTLGGFTHGFFLPCDVPILVIIRFKKNSSELLEFLKYRLLSASSIPGHPWKLFVAHRYSRVTILVFEEWSVAWDASLNILETCPLTLQDMGWICTDLLNQSRCLAIRNRSPFKVAQSKEGFA